MNERYPVLEGERAFQAEGNSVCHVHGVYKSMAHERN